MLHYHITSLQILHIYISLLIQQFIFFVLGSLQIKSSEEKDQGKYECVAENSIGTEYSKSAQLYVKGNSIRDGMIRKKGN